jgi:hypothetical protein
MGLGHARYERVPSLVPGQRMVGRHGPLGHPVIPASPPRLSDKLSDNHTVLDGYCPTLVDSDQPETLCRQRGWAWHTSCTSSTAGLCAQVDGIVGLHDEPHKML